MIKSIISIISGIIPIIIAILVFSLLVIIHELGHFMIAKKNGIKVEEFSVGMGPLLFSKQKGETIYSIRALPLGGYCKMLGEDENCKDKRAFNNKGVIARMSVIAAGPFMNFVFAFLLIVFLLSSTNIVLPIVSELRDGYSAKQTGVEVGDRIVSVDGQNVKTYEDLQIAMSSCDGSDIEVIVKRDGGKLDFNITPVHSPETGSWIIGFTPTIKTGFFADRIDGYEKAGFAETIITSFFTMISYIKSTIIGFVRIITLKISTEEMSGPIGIIQIIGESYETGLKSSIMAAIQNIVYLAALLSANLGAINLFPIPAMDGGRLAFLFIEGIRRKPINPEKEGMIHFAGFVILMIFMVFIAYNDISKIFMG